MNAVALFLAGDGALMALAVLAVTIAPRPFAPVIIYGAALAISAALMIAAVVHLLGKTPIDRISLPLGLPWIGTRFRIDALSAFFLVIVNLGGSAASLYGLGDGGSERSLVSACCLFFRRSSSA
jgi:formate hydrogenlyase subunit 3/multisubunit Na+/H+ antiporter MnhD subunit